MCTTCGCSSTINIPAPSYAQDHRSEPGHTHHHDLEHAHRHKHPHQSQPDSSEARILEVEKNLLDKNNFFAKQNRERFESLGTLAFNFVSSPGAGKTTLLVKTIEALRADSRVAVIEGDQQTENDAERIRATGAKAVQINTGKGCHLDAHAVGHAFDPLASIHNDYLFIENVGNLVCPAAFDLGESAKILVLSVTEGADKPLKYPDMFKASDLLLINKIDLLPYVDFNLAQCIEYARRINPGLHVVQLSATTAEGFDSWLKWLKERRVQSSTTQPASA